MNRHSFLLLAAAACAAPAALAQGCSANVHPVTMVTADGTPAPLFQGQYEPYARFSTEAVYMAFAPTTPTGTYYVHVTDVLGDPADDVVLSRNDPMERIVALTNTNGVITLSLPYTNTPDPKQFGVGLNGQGQSLALFPFASAPHTPCEFAVQMGDTFELAFGADFPYVVRSGYSTVFDRCAVQSYGLFQVQNGGGGSTVAGRVVLDDNRNGAVDSGETGVGGQQVRLVSGSTSTTLTTDSAGNYSFTNVPAGSYSVEVVVSSAYLVTAAGSLEGEVCGCGDITGLDFSIAPVVLNCQPKPRCFWISYHGRQVVQQAGILPTLPGLYLRDWLGRQVAPTNTASFSWFLATAISINMANRLSAEVAVMHCNILAENVHPACVINDAVLGQITVAELMGRAIASLATHPLTTWNSPQRAGQMALKNALENANNNRRWR
ncbi:MAG: hypothetical protein JNK49_15485 [Planctomycetes bacterium]|nr:hypothetical protein [Planctomycetota bacterium]